MASNRHLPSSSVGRIVVFNHYTLSISAAALLIACGGSLVPIGTPGAMHQTTGRSNQRPAD
jgi:hypothetical protein